MSQSFNVLSSEADTIKQLSNDQQISLIPNVCPIIDFLYLPS